MSTSQPADAFAVSVSDDGDRVIVSVRGELDLVTAPRLGSTLDEVLVARPRTVAVDAHAVTFADSSAISALLAAHRTATAAGVAFGIESASAPLRKVLELTGVHTVLMVPPPSG